MLMMPKVVLICKITAERGMVDINTHSIQVYLCLLAPLVKIMMVLLYHHDQNIPDMYLTF